MAANYPNLTPEQFAFTVEVGRYFARCDRGVTHTVRVERVFVTGWCHVRSVSPRPLVKPWTINTSVLRRDYHPTSAPAA